MREDVTYEVGASPSIELMVRMLYLSSYDWLPDDAPRPMLEEFSRESEVVPRWTSGWGRAGDAAVVASMHGAPVGAVLCRLLRADDSGNSFVSEDIPCLAIAIERHARGKGIGGVLLDRMRAHLAATGVAAVTLAVEDGNPAARLYPRHGFVPEVAQNGYTRMRAVLNAPGRDG